MRPVDTFPSVVHVGKLAAAIFTLSTLILPIVHGQVSTPSLPPKQSETAPVPSNLASPAPAVDLTQLNPEQREYVRLLENPLPRLELSDDLKKLGFSASYRLNDSQKQMLALANAKDLSGVVRLLTGKNYSQPSNLDDAADKLHRFDQRLAIAILSDNVTVRGEQFIMQGENPRTSTPHGVSVLPTSQDQQIFTVQPKGHLEVKVPYKGGPIQVTEVHPTAKGFLFYAQPGDYTACFYLDWRDRLDSPWRKFGSDLGNLNKQYDLGELSAEQLLQKGKGCYQTFLNIAKPLIQIASGQANENVPASAVSSASAVSGDTTAFSTEQLNSIKWLEMPPPELAMTAKLKQFGFTASYRFTDEQKQLITLSAAKDMPGIVKALTGQVYIEPNDLDSAVGRAEAYEKKFIASIQSDNITVQGREFRAKNQSSPNRYCVSVLLLPKDTAHPFTRLAKDHLTPRVYFSSGEQRDFEANALGNGFLFHVPRGDYVALFFLDWPFQLDGSGKMNTHGPGRVIEGELTKLNVDMEKLNQRLDLKELTYEQLLEIAHARYKTFADAVRPQLE